MNTYLEFVKTNHHIETNCNRMKNKIEKIRKNEYIYKTIAQKCFNSQHNLQHNTCNQLKNEQTLMRSLLHTSR